MDFATMLMITGLLIIGSVAIIFVAKEVETLKRTFKRTIQNIRNFFRSKEEVQKGYDDSRAKAHQEWLERELKPTELICKDGTRVVMQLVLEPERHYHIHRNDELIHSCMPVDRGGHMSWSFRQGAMMGTGGVTHKVITLKPYGDSFLLTAKEGDDTIIRVGERVVRIQDELVEVNALNDTDLIYVTAIHDQSKKAELGMRMNQRYRYEVYRFGDAKPLRECEDLPHIIPMKEKGVFTVISYSFQDFPLTETPVPAAEQHKPTPLLGNGLVSA